MRTSMKILNFDTRDKGKCFRATTNQAKQSVPRAGLLVFDGHTVHALPRLASLPPSITVPLSPVIAMTQVTKLVSLSSERIPGTEVEGSPTSSRPSAIRPANHVIARRAELSSD